MPLFQSKPEIKANESFNLTYKERVQPINTVENNYFKNNFICNYSNNNNYNQQNYSLLNNQNNIQNINFLYQNNMNEKKEKNNIITLLKNNPNINSYIHLIDNISVEELLMMFSFILKNISTFISNNQSFLLINKIISIYNLKINNNDININVNDEIYSFLKSFFSKRITILINSNNFISSVINLVIKIGFPKNDFVYIDIKNEFKNYGFNRQGCILIQNLFPLGNEYQQQNLLGIILQLYNELIVDKYGHYLFKYLLYQPENGEKYYNDIFNKIINDVKRYTNNKYSSVVIERLLDSSNLYIKNKIIEKLCSTEKDVVELIYHAYGNYVLQKIIKVVKDDNILEMIYKTIIKNKESLYKLSYGKKIMKEISAAYTLK